MIVARLTMFGSKFVDFNFESPCNFKFSIIITYTTYGRGCIKLIRTNVTRGRA